MFKKLLTRIKSWFIQAPIESIPVVTDGYTPVDDAVIIAAYYNPQNNPYRLSTFLTWYETIKHLNYRIIELSIDGAPFELPDMPNLTRLESDTWLWHKESLLNHLIRHLPPYFKWVFWVDTDVIFMNKNWLVEAVTNMKKTGAQFIQPFGYCIHLAQNQTEPSDQQKAATGCYMPNKLQSTVWRSFAKTLNDYPALAQSTDYNAYGHVGFAWGASQALLDKCPLFDQALVGGADHVMALGASAKLNHPSMQKGFSHLWREVLMYQTTLAGLTNGKIAHAEGILYHLWHGDIQKREYLKRLQEFGPTNSRIKGRDVYGLPVASKKEDKYVRDYMSHREDTTVLPRPSDSSDTLDTTLFVLDMLTAASDVADGVMDTPTSTSPEFGGGEFGGGGAGGDYSLSENFS